jgi:hypothetical protein
VNGMWIECGKGGHLYNEVCKERKRDVKVALRKFKMKDDV